MESRLVPGEYPGVAEEALEGQPSGWFEYARRTGGVFRPPSGLGSVDRVPRLAA